MIILTESKKLRSVAMSHSEIVNFISFHISLKIV